MRRIDEIVTDINKKLSENADEDRDDGDGDPGGDSGLTLRFVSTHGGFHFKKGAGSTICIDAWWQKNIAKRLMADLRDQINLRNPQLELAGSLHFIFNIHLYPETLEAVADSDYLYFEPHLSRVVQFYSKMPSKFTKKTLKVFISNICNSSMINSYYYYYHELSIHIIITTG